MQTFARHRTKSQAVGTSTPVFAGPLGAPVARQRHDIRQLLGRPRVQAKLRVSEPNDPLEREADRVADHVMSAGPDGAVHQTGNAGQSVQRMCANCADEIDATHSNSETVHRQADAVEEEEEQVQAKSRDGGTGQSADAAVASGIGAGQPLPTGLRSFFEPRFGQSFEKVRIHTGKAANEAADGLNARAFTHGSDIVFGAGEYQPEAVAGRHLMAHELAHTIQQGENERSVQRKVDASQVKCEGLSKKRQLIVGDDPVKAISDANERAIKHLGLVIDALNGAKKRIEGGAPIAWPTISDVVAIGLSKRFGLNFRDKEVWTGTGDKTVDALNERYQKVRAALFGDMITYFCLAPTKSEDPDHSGHKCGGEWAFVIAGEFNMFLCKPWWTASLDDRATTLMHEAIHMADKTVSDSGRKTLNAHCYDHYLADVNGLTIPKPFVGSC